MGAWGVYNADTVKRQRAPYTRYIQNARRCCWPFCHASLNKTIWTTWRRDADATPHSRACFCL